MNEELKELQKETENLLKNNLNLANNCINFIFQDLPNFEKWKKKEIKEPNF